MKVSLRNVADPLMGGGGVVVQAQLLPAGCCLRSFFAVIAVVTRWSTNQQPFSPQMCFQLRLFSHVALGDTELLQHLRILLL